MISSANTKLDFTQRLSGILQKNFIACAAVFIFILIRLPYFVQGVYRFDEMWHSSIMWQFRLVNDQSFGTAYWIAGYLIYKIFGPTDYLLALRVLSFVSILYSAVVFYQLAKNNCLKTAPLVLVAILTSPVIWFGGKLITPEFYQIAMLALAAFALFSAGKAPRWAFVLLGFCFGMKISALPAVFCLLLLYFFYKEKNPLFDKVFYREAGIAFALFAAGFVLCSPNVIWDFAGFKANLFSNALHHSSVKMERGFYFDKSVFWDYIQDNGLFYSFCSLASLMAYAAYILIEREYRLFFICLVSLFAMVLSLRVNYVDFLPWHAFQSIVIVWLGLSIGSRGDVRNLRLKQVMLVVGIFANIWVIVPQVKADIKAQNMFTQYDGAVDVYDDCIAHFMAKADPAHRAAISCYASYLYDSKRNAFCEMPRLHQALERNGYPVPDNTLKHDSEFTEDSMDETIQQRPIIEIVNEEIPKIFGQNSSETQIIGGIIANLKRDRGRVITSKRVGQCGIYGFYRHELQGGTK